MDLFNRGMNTGSVKPIISPTDALALIETWLALMLI